MHNEAGRCLRGPQREATRVEQSIYFIILFLLFYIWGKDCRRKNLAIGKFFVCLFSALYILAFALWLYCMLLHFGVILFRNQTHEETSPYLLLGAQDQRLGAKQDQLPCGSTGTSSGNCQETETCIVRACRTPRQPLQNHPSGHLGRFATLWSAEEMLDGQHQGENIPARTADRGLLQERLEGNLC